MAAKCEWMTNFCQKQSQILIESAKFGKKWTKYHKRIARGYIGFSKNMHIGMAYFIKCGEYSLEKKKRWYPEWKP